MFKRAIITPCTNGHCHCKERQSHARFTKVTKSTKTLPSVLLSFLIAFFPKCPVCWAIYASMFSSVGLTRLPYMPWLLPVMILFLGLNLLFLYKKSRLNGYLPFLLSLIGVVLVVGFRWFMPDNTIGLYFGIAFIFSGSLVNAILDIKLNSTIFSN